MIQQVNTYQNTQQLSLGGSVGIINNLAINTPTPAVNGIQGVAFPVSSTLNKTTAATPVKFGK